MSYCKADDVEKANEAVLHAKEYYEAARAKKSAYRGLRRAIRLLDRAKEAGEEEYTLAAKSCYEKALNVYNAADFALAIIEIELRAEVIVVQPCVRHATQLTLMDTIQTYQGELLIEVDTTEIDYYEITYTAGKHALLSIRVGDSLNTVVPVLEELGLVSV